MPSAAKSPMTARLHDLQDWFIARLPRRGSPAAYGAAVLLMLAALLLRLEISPVEAGLQYLTFFPAVALTAIIGGLRPGLLATLIGIGLATFVFTPPYGTPSLEVLRNSFPSNAVFLFDGLIVCSAIEAMHVYRQRFEDEFAEAEENGARVRAINEELARRTQQVATLNVELVIRASEADAANRAKSRFLANMSHEIRTPLHGILGLAHLLRRDAADPVQRDRLERLCAASDHLLALINDILDLSKIEAQRLELDRRDFRLGAVVDQVLRMVEGRAQEKGVALRAQVAPEVRALALSGDPLRLAQVLINLCGNAVKFTDAGEVRLRIERLADDADGIGLRCAVEDTGPGIAPEDVARLFQAFEQGDQAAGERGGTGLGLTISQRLVALMGGSIRVDSAVGRGSCFSFELRLRPAAGSVDAEAAPDAAGAADFQDCRVLVAEDHPLAQEVLLEMLEELGCIVDVAADGAEAVECVRARGYDLVLMDMQMPKLDGLAAARAIRALPGRGELPIIALTANAFAEDRLRCLEAGMSDHLAKPVTVATLAATLGRWRPVAAPTGDDVLGRALAGIDGLRIGAGWRQSAAQATAFRVQLDRFIAHHAGDMARLREHLAAGNLEAVRAVAHDLKGIAALVGAWRVAALADDIMRLGPDQAGDPAALLTLAAACEAELMKLADAARALSA